MIVASLFAGPDFDSIGWLVRLCCVLRRFPSFDIEFDFHLSRRPPSIHNHRKQSLQWNQTRHTSNSGTGEKGEKEENADEKSVVECESKSIKWYSDSIWFDGIETQSIDQPSPPDLSAMNASTTSTQTDYKNNIIRWRRQRIERNSWVLIRLTLAISSLQQNLWRK